MTKYLLCVIGTPGGDLRPCLAISRELVRRGHRVTIASHESYRAMVEQEGFEFIDLLPAMDLEQGTRWFEYATESHVKEYKYLFRDLINPNADRNLKRLAGNADFDVLLCSAGSFFAPLLAEKLGKIWGLFTYQPVAFTSEFGRTLIVGRTWRTNLLRRVTLPNPFGRLVSTVGKIVSDTWMAPVKKIRNALDLPPTRELFLFDTLHRSPHFNFALFSGIFAKAADDWPQPLIQTGFVWDRQDHVPLSNRILKFLGEGGGDLPLLISLGSFGLATSGGRKFFENAVKACTSAGKRAIVVVGRNRDLLAESGNDNIVISQHEPFQKLLPRVSMLVHMGGLGTIAEGLRAGKPQLLVPFSYEQCDNALRLQELGLSRTLPIARCDSSSLAREIELTDTAAYRKRAAEVMGLVKDEDGAGVVADYLEKLS